MSTILVGRLEPKDIRPNKNGENRWIKGIVKPHVKCMGTLREIGQKKLPFTFVTGQVLPKDFAILMGELSEYPIPGTDIIWKTLEIKKLIPRDDDLLKHLGVNFEEAIRRVAAKDEAFLDDIGNLELKIQKKLTDLVGTKNRFAALMMNQFGLDAYDELKKNPWKMMHVIPYFGIEQADKVAAKLGIPLTDKRRFYEYFRLLLEQSVSDHRNTYLTEHEFEAFYWMHFSDQFTLEEFKKQATEHRKDAPVKKTALGYHPSEFYYAERASGDLVFRSLGIQIPETKREMAITKQLMENGDGFVPTKEQMHAITHAFHTPLHLLTGGPGTGKTTVLRMIVNKLMMLTGAGPHEEYAPFLLVAPTGKAAYRMYEQTGVPAKTIHSAFSIIPGYGCPNREEVAKRLSHVEYLIIDESSMLDTLLFGELCQILLSMSHIPFLLLVGDVDQLPPVGHGQVFKDLLLAFEKLAPERITRLTEVKRQTGDSHIPELAAFIRKGLFPDLEWFADKPDLFFVETDMDAFPKILTHGVLLPKKEELEHIQILTPYRNGSTPDTIFAVNRMVEPIYNPKKDRMEQSITAGNPAKTFRVGDKVINRTNRTQTVINGSLGEVVKIHQNSKDVFAWTMDVKFESGDLENFSYEDLKYLEPAYAITIHASQGSEYENVVMMLLRGAVSPDFLNQNLLYVGATRAQKRLVFLGSINTFKRAAATQGRPRKTAFSYWLDHPQAAPYYESE